MKKELREEIKREQIRGKKSKLSKLIDDNKGVVKALGIASFVALAGYSASQLLKDKELVKKIKDGLKTPKGLKFFEGMLKKNESAKGLVASNDGKEKPTKNKTAVKAPVSAKKAGTTKSKAKKSGE